MQATPIKAQDEQRTTKHSKHKQASLSDSEALKIVEEADRLLCKGDNLESINLLRALKENMQGVKSQNITTLVLANLGILYYQVGFLEEAQQELLASTLRLKQMSSKTLSSRGKDCQRIRYDTLLAKLQLQLCILFSQMGKHSQALEHARNASRTSFNLIIDILARLHHSLHPLLKHDPPSSKQQAANNSYHKGDKKDRDIIANSISILQQLLMTTKDLKLAFAQKDRVSLLDQQAQMSRKLGWSCPKVDLELLYRPQDRQDYLWIYKNKILDEIQLVPFEITDFEVEGELQSNDVIQKITYLAISLYCYSTQTRFIEKQQQCDSHDVLDSEHWLSRSLEIAYCFLPPQAPILNQIITVHDRFHGLDKQTIPQDQQVTGFFKVLRPLSKPKSTFSSKSPGSSPIMIRIQADKVAVELPAGIQLHPASKTYREQPNVHLHEGPSTNLIQLDRPTQTLDIQGLTRNNRIRNYSHGHRRVETTDPQLGKPTLSARTTIEASHPNVRANYANKKFGKKKDERLRVNLSELNGKALLSQDLLGRPSSLEDKTGRQNDRELQARTFLNEKRRKSLPTRKAENPKKREEQLLELKGRRMDEEPEAKTLGGNVYINNNINLFISRGQSFGQTFVRGQVREGDGPVRQKDEGSRRQMFLNRRRANNFIELE